MERAMGIEFHPKFLSLTGARCYPPLPQAIVAKCCQNDLTIFLSPWDPDSHADLDGRSLSAQSDMDFNWMIPQARLRNLQNRLGFTVTLARQAGGNDSLRQPEQALTESKLEKEDSC